MLTEAPPAAVPQATPSERLEWVEIAFGALCNLDSVQWKGDELLALSGLVVELHGVLGGFKEGAVTDKEFEAVRDDLLATHRFKSIDDVSSIVSYMRGLVATDTVADRGGTNLAELLFVRVVAEAMLKLASEAHALAEKVNGPISVSPVLTEWTKLLDAVKSALEAATGSAGRVLATVIISPPAQASIGPKAHARAEAVASEIVEHGKPKSYPPPPPITAKASLVPGALQIAGLIAVVVMIAFCLVALGYVASAWFSRG